MEKLKKHSLKICITIIAVLIIALVIVIMVLKPKKADTVPASLQGVFEELETTTLTTIELSQLTEQVGELTTQKYYYKDIHEETKEKEGFFDSEEQTLIVYEGVIHAGVDLQEIAYELDNTAKKIYVVLPEPKILAHEFDNNSVKSYTVKKGIFSKEPSYEASAQKFEELQQIKEEAVMEDEEFLKSVITDTETTLTEFFKVSDLTKDYTVEYVESMPEIPETEPEADSEGEDAEAPDAE
ncbi:MAG: DUF4230 domain-containing protein [Oscillospiraceae bacterium]|nr:DUF4230 domain-containing protein [Oscillospiraceae bacterium]